MIAVVAVIGVLAMHGLTTDDDAAMTSMVAGDATGLPVAATSAGHDAGTELQPAVGPAGTGLPAAVGSAADGAPLPVLGTGSPHGMDGTAMACLAFLTGSLLLFGARRLLAQLRRTTYGSSLGRGLAWLATARQRFGPDLAELSVLRT